MLRNRGVAAGAVVLLLTVAVAIVLQQPAHLAISELTPAPGQTAPSGTGPGVTPPPGLLGAPETVDGLPVRSVPEAITLRDAGSTDRIAVAGWGLWYAVPCPMPRDAFQPLENCVYQFTWLLALPQNLWTTNADGSATLHGPAGPGFNLTALTPEAGVPQAIVVIGRFHDPQAIQCPAGERRVACDRLFVAEGIFWFGGVAPAEPAGLTPSGS